MKPVTLETLAADQNDRIARSKLKTGDNAILDWINNFNQEIRFTNNFLNK